MKKIKNIQELWVYAKNTLPKYCKISSVKHSAINSFFDIEIPKSNVIKFPDDARRTDLLFTLTETEGDIEILCENTGMIETIVEYIEFDEILLTTINESLKESLNESKSIFIKINASNFGEYKIDIHAFSLMHNVSDESDFWYVKRYNEQNEKNPDIIKIEELLTDIKPINTKFANCVNASIFKLANKGIIIIEHGVSKYDENIYISNNIFSSTMNENAVISITDNDELRGFDKIIIFSYKGVRKDLEKNLDKLKLKYFVEVYPSHEAGLYCSKHDVDVFTKFVNVLNEGSIITTGKIISYAENDTVTTKTDNIIQTALNGLSDIMSELKDSTDADNIVAYKTLEDRYNIINSINIAVNESLNEGSKLTLKDVLLPYEIAMITSIFKGSPKEIEPMMDERYKPNAVFKDLLYKYDREIEKVLPDIEYSNFMGNKIRIWENKKFIFISNSETKNNIIIIY